MSSNTPVQKIILTATLASAYLSGGLSSISLLGIPALSTSPSNSILVAQFTHMYRLGRLTQPPLTLLTSLVWFYAAYAHYQSKLCWKVLAGAGASVLSILGFTYVVLEPTSHALMDMMHYHDIERNDGQEEKALLRRWGVLNVVRAGMAGVATGLGAWVLLV